MLCKTFMSNKICNYFLLPYNIKLKLKLPKCVKIYTVQNTCCPIALKVCFIIAKSSFLSSAFGLIFEAKWKPTRLTKSNDALEPEYSLQGYRDSRTVYHIIVFRGYVCMGMVSADLSCKISTSHQPTITVWQSAKI